MFDKYLPTVTPYRLLAATVPVALSCGTLFVYLVYGTQLAERCNLASSQAANLNISATVGSSLGGLVGGYVTDLYGAQISVLASLVLLSLGYKWLHSLYGAGAGAAPLLLVCAMFFVGLGSTASYFAALKLVTLAFPKYKGSAQSVTIALFAISSLMYSYICLWVFAGDVGKFLLFLSLSSFAMHLVGVLYIRNPHPDYESLPLISPSESDTEANGYKHLSLRELVSHPVFWAHFAIMAVVQGLGQMYIYSVGFIAKALHYEFASSEAGLQHLQALQVSLIAVFSFFGRLASGPMADLFVHKLGAQRHWALVIGVAIMFCGHFFLSTRFDRTFSSMHAVHAVLLAISCLVGFAYGFSFTTFPAIVSDLFHMRNYSLLWGITYSSTTLGLTVFTKIFGHIYDGNSEWDGDDLVCHLGAGCYVDTFKITSFLAIFALLAILGYITKAHRL